MLQRKIVEHLQKTEKILQQTRYLIEKEIKKIDKNCNSFKTVTGSKTLSMLASFERGRDILKLLLSNESLAFSVSSYSVSIAYESGNLNLAESTRYNYCDSRGSKMGTNLRKISDRRLSDSTNQTKTMHENVLAILIREKQYSLYHLMLNRILLDSSKYDPECLTIIKDVVLLLFENNNSGKHIAL